MALATDESSGINCKVNRLGMGFVVITGRCVIGFLRVEADTAFGDGRILQGWEGMTTLGRELDNMVQERIGE